MQNKRLLIILGFIFLVQNVVFTQLSTYGLEFRSGYNYSEANYGIAPLDNLIPISDYPIFARSEEGALGYSFGIGASCFFGNRLELLTHIDFFQLNYDVGTAALDSGSIPPNRPVQPDVPVIIAGTVGYAYLNIETGLRYNFSPDSRSRPFVGIFISDMIHLNTDWTFQVKYQDNQVKGNVDFSENQQGIEYRNVFFAGMNAGCHFKVTEHFSLSPMIDFRYGMNPVVKIDDPVSVPYVFGFNLLGKWWF